MSRLSTKDMLAINRQCDALESAMRSWRDDDAVDQPFVESFTSGMPDRLIDAALHQMIPIEMEYRSAMGQTLRVREFEQRFPTVDRSYFVELIQESLVDTGRSQADPTALAVDANSKGRISAGETDEGVGAAEPTGGELAGMIGQYEITRKLGGGGMGTVYQAVHRKMQRDVAIKVMRGDLVDQDQLRKRFGREVLAAAKLVHPNVVTAYDAGEIDGRPFLVTELIDGIDLKRFVKENGPMPWSTALRCAKDAALGLKYAHENEIIHRDIKPANLLLDQSGAVKLLDLGLARLSIQPGTSQPGKEGEDTDATAQLTHTGAVMGTAGYMAPEQARNTRAADARSDVYSLGCVVYFLISGKPPYRGESVVDTILAHATSPIPNLVAADTIPEPVSELVRSMMAKDPSGRPQSMDEVITRLDDCLREPVEESRPLPSVKIAATDKTASGSSGVSWVGYVIILAIVGGLIWMIRSVVSPGPDTTANRALVFQGDGYVSVPSFVSGPGDEVTIEMIVRLDQLRLANPVSWLGNNWMTLFHNGNWGVGRRQDGQSLFAVSREDAQDPLGTWQHIAGTWDGDQLRLFVDGQFVQQRPIDFELVETSPGLFIGGVDPTRLPSGQNDRFFVGAIDSVRISDRVVYAGEDDFKPPKRLESTRGTRALYEFDEPVGSERFLDSSGNGHDGIAINVDSISVP